MFTDLQAYNEIMFTVTSTFDKKIFRNVYGTYKLRQL